MSFKAGLTKIVIKCTPNTLVKWIANIILKDVAKLTGYIFDLDARKAFVQIQLAGESETIDVSLDGFAIISDGDTHKFIIYRAESNRLWLDKILSRIEGKAWTLPETSHTEFMTELLKAKSPEHEEN